MVTVKTAGASAAAVIAITVASLAAGGCRTQADAVAAASQMTITANDLAAYYSALAADVQKTGQLYQLQAAVAGIPYDAEDRSELAGHVAAMRERAAFAGDFATLTANFSKLTGSTAATDVSASAAKLETEADAMASHTPRTPEQNAIKAGLELLVHAIQEKKERDAARAVDRIAAAFSRLFANEAPNCEELAATYIATAKGMSLALLQTGDVDGGSFLAVALEPFGLSAKTGSAEIQQKLLPLEQAQVVATATAMVAKSMQATEAMQASLMEMQQRVHRVATDKPMAHRLAPVQLSAVEQWTKQANAF